MLPVTRLFDLTCLDLREARRGWRGVTDNDSVEYLRFGAVKIATLASFRLLWRRTEGHHRQDDKLNESVVITIIAIRVNIIITSVVIWITWDSTCSVALTCSSTLRADS